MFVRPPRLESRQPSNATRMRCSVASEQRGRIRYGAKATSRITAGSTEPEGATKRDPPAPIPPLCHGRTAEEKEVATREALGDYIQQLSSLTHLYTVKNLIARTARTPPHSFAWQRWFFRRATLPAWRLERRASLREQDMFVDMFGR